VTDKYGYAVSARRIVAADQRTEYKSQNCRNQKCRSQWPVHIAPLKYAGYKFDFPYEHGFIFTIFFWGGGEFQKKSCKKKSYTFFKSVCVGAYNRLRNVYAFWYSVAIMFRQQILKVFVYSYLFLVNSSMYRYPCILC